MKWPLFYYLHHISQSLLIILCAMDTTLWLLVLLKVWRMWDSVYICYRILIWKLFHKNCRFVKFVKKYLPEYFCIRRVLEFWSQISILIGRECLERNWTHNRRSKSETKIILWKERERERERERDFVCTFSWKENRYYNIFKCFI